MLPADGARQLCREQGRPLSAGVVGKSVDVRDDRNFGVANVCSGDGLTQAIARGCHERGVEGPRDLERHDLLRTEFFCVFRGRLDTVG